MSLVPKVMLPMTDVELMAAGKGRKGPAGGVPFEPKIFRDDPEGNMARLRKKQPAFTLLDPENYMREKKTEAESLGIAPPRSGSPLDILEYETRANERREIIIPGKDADPRQRPWGRGSTLLTGI